jgi:hypothetical protein
MQEASRAQDSAISPTCTNQRDRFRAFLSHLSNPVPRWSPDGVPVPETYGGTSTPVPRREAVSEAPLVAVALMVVLLAPFDCGLKATVSRQNGAVWFGVGAADMAAMQSGGEPLPGR